MQAFFPTGSKLGQSALHWIMTTINKQKIEYNKQRTGRKTLKPVRGPFNNVAIKKKKLTANAHSALYSGVSVGDLREKSHSENCE